MEGSREKLFVEFAKGILLFYVTLCMQEMCTCMFMFVYVEIHVYICIHYSKCQMNM